MNDIFDLYQEMIIDHSRRPKNFGALTEKSHHARGHNPLCGDVIDVEILLSDNNITNIAFLGDGCAISKASASLMTEAVKGKTFEEAMKIFDSFHAMLTLEKDPENLGKLEVFKGVRQFPARVKCATLCWHTFHAALTNDADVTTE